MKKTLFAGFALATMALLAQNVRPNVKIGLWEETITTSRNGTPLVSNNVLSKLTPEQRARVEARMKAEIQPITRTEKKCLTQHDLDQNVAVFDKPDSNCTYARQTSTSTRVDAQWECKASQGVTMNGTLHIDILSPEEARGTLNTVIDGNGLHSVSESRIETKWIGPDCGKAH